MRDQHVDLASVVHHTLRHAGVVAQRTRVGEQLSRELATRLGVALELVTFDAAGKVVEVARSGVWDVAFVAIDPARGQDMLQSPPYGVSEGAYLVAADSPMQRNEDVDREGVRIAVGKGSAYDLFLTRQLKHARIVRGRGDEGVGLRRAGARAPWHRGCGGGATLSPAHARGAMSRLATPCVGNGAASAPVECWVMQRCHCEP